MNKKYTSLLSVGVLSIGILTGCGEADDVNTGVSNDTGKKNEQAQTSKKEEGAKKFDAGISQ